MKVFVTGASGFIGSAVVQELLRSGHSVLGLARSEASAEGLKAAGAEVLSGSLEDLESLRTGARESDGVIHTAFNHDFSKFLENCEAEQAAVEAMGSVLVGSDRTMVVTSGTALVAPGQLATEDMRPVAGPESFPRVAVELGVDQLAERGVRICGIRCAPSVHGDGDHGFIPGFIGAAVGKGVSAYVWDGSNRWPAVHRLDAARLFRLALEHGRAGARYHAVGETGIPFKAIAEAIGAGLGIPVASIPPEEAMAQFGFLGNFAGLDCPASSAATEAELGWSAVQPGLLEDLAHGTYFKS